MNKRIIAALALALGLAAFASATLPSGNQDAFPTGNSGNPGANPGSPDKAASPALKIVNFTGQIKISYTENGVTKEVNVLPGGEVPANIPAGAQVTVVSGEATFSAGNTTIQANSGDSFSVSAAPAAGGPAGSAQVQITVTKGDVQVTSPGQPTQTVSQGQTATTAPPPAQQQPPQQQQQQQQQTQTAETTTTSPPPPPPPPPPSPQQSTTVVSPSSP